MRALALAVASIVIACGPHSGGPDGPGGGIDAPGGTPDAAGPPTCVFHPTGVFNPQIECAWNGPAPGVKYPALDDVVMTPVVINLTDDNADGQVTLDDVPDIAFISYQLQTDTTCPPGVVCGCCNSDGVLRVVSGGCDTSGVLPDELTIGPDEIFADIGVANVWLDNSGGLAVGDIDGDGSVDIVATVDNGGTIAFERTGHVKWYQPAYPAMGTDHLAGTQPAIADLDSDGHPEVLMGRTVLRGADGALAFDGTAGVGTNGFLGPVTVAGDVDLDGKPELLAGNTLYHFDGTPMWSYPYAIPIDSQNCQSSGFPCDGFTATGNFDTDDQGEIVIARAGMIYILNHDGTPMLYNGAPVEIALPVDDCTKNEGGPPTVADFDGDGAPEIGVAGADFYIVADLECLDTPMPAQCVAPGIRWTAGNADCSSRVTGSSVFDFEGDGRAEVIYADETAFRVFDGVDGTVKLDIPNHSHTRLEMPIVVDADNDGNAEVVYIENANGGGTTQGIRVLGDATDSWVATRRVWNQHSYHVTNVSELGAIPVGEKPNWLEPTTATVSGVMNNFRQNLPAQDAFAAPDLTLALSIDASACTIGAHVCNAGDVVVGAGVPIHFYDNATMTEIGCAGGPVVTPNALNPGACVDVVCTFPDPTPSGAVDVRGCVDNDGYTCASGIAGGNNECHEDNNLANATGTPNCVPNP